MSIAAGGSAGGTAGGTAGGAAGGSAGGTAGDTAGGSAGGWGLAVEVVKAVRAPVRPAALRAALRAAAAEPRVGRRLPSAAAALTLKITGTRELRRLNRAFLGEDRPTDVLSFPSPDAAQTGYLGDVAISWPAVARQAAAAGHSEEAEVTLLAVHGLLHLLGWDHAGAADERRMWALTAACLDLAGVSIAPERLAPRPLRRGQVPTRPLGPATDPAGRPL